jgi:hypothetical protein
VALLFQDFDGCGTPGTEGGPWTETTLYSMTGYPNGCSPINVALGTDTHDGQESDRTVCLGDGADGCDDWRGDRDDDERSRHFAKIQLAQQSDYVYFLGKLILAESNSVTTGRPGSVRSGGPGEMGYRIGRPRCLTPVARTPYYGRFSRSSWGALTG